MLVDRGRHLDALEWAWFLNSFGEGGFYDHMYGDKVRADYWAGLATGLRTGLDWSGVGGGTARRHTVGARARTRARTHTRKRTQTHKYTKTHANTRKHPNKHPNKHNANARQDTYGLAFALAGKAHAYRHVNVPPAGLFTRADRLGWTPKDDQMRKQVCDGDDDGDDGDDDGGVSPLGVCLQGGLFEIVVLAAAHNTP